MSHKIKRYLLLEKQMVFLYLETEFPKHKNVLSNYKNEYYWSKLKQFDWLEITCSYERGLCTKYTDCNNYRCENEEDYFNHLTFNRFPYALSLTVSAYCFPNTISSFGSLLNLVTKSSLYIPAGLTYKCIQSYLQK